MSNLLISVRNLNEALLAVSAGADVIDIKQPARGSLGAADLADLRTLVQGMPPQVPISAAMGELLDPQPRLRPDDLDGLSYAKFGLAGCAHRADWAERWRSQIELFPAGVAAVAVVYADFSADAPPAEDVIAVAVAARAAAVLVDTFDKNGGGLLSHWSLDVVAKCIEHVQELGLKIALAGSLDQKAIQQLLPLRPDLIAVRGAVCQRGRSGPLDPLLVRQLVSWIRSAPTATASCG